LIERLDRERFEPILCCLHGSDNLRFRECRSLNLELHSFSSLGAIKRLFSLARFLKKEKVDLLVTFFKNANYFGTLAGRISGVPKIISTRRNLGYWQTKRDLLLLKIIKRWTDFVIANSSAVRDSVVKKEGVEASKIEVIYNGIDLDEFTNRLIPREEAKRKLGLSPQTPLVGTLSNLRPVKAVDIFIKSAFVVSKKFPQTKFMIVGEGPQKRDLETLVERLGMKDRVIFAGGAAEVFPYLSAFDIGVLSSLSEGFSNSILEYMLAGLPVVASVVGGNPEIVNEGENGYLVPPGEPQPLAKKIMALLEDERLRSEFGENARLKVAENFSLTRMVAEFERRFMRLCRREGDTDDGDVDLRGRKASLKEKSLMVLSGKGV
jgi:glycosyltransferase involved in cell wall biosynthesis